jgi:hypothetical protein
MLLTPFGIYAYLCLLPHNYSLSTCLYGNSGKYNSGQTYLRAQ